MSSEHEANLILKDRMNYPYILAQAIITLHQTVINPQYTAEQNIDAIKNLWTAIPSSWEDKQFKDDIDKAKKSEDVDARPQFCGIPASEKFCLAHKITKTKKQETYDYDKLKRACIDLLSRRGMMSKTVYTETFTGKRAKEELEDVTETGVEEV